MNLTKYSNLTDDELITEALVILTNEDDLGLELLSRLMDMKDELDRWKTDYEDELREIEHQYDVTKPLKLWVDDLGVTQQCVYYWIKKGLSYGGAIERILSKKQSQEAAQ